MERRKSRKIRGRAVLAAAVFFAVWLLYGTEFISDALFDTSRAVHINPDEIEESTLIIGTHLIYLHSMTDDIYDVAVQSASDSNQNNRYYKSELAGGAWYDITNATSLADISDGGTMAANDEIAALFLTHHTKKDGVTYALSDGSAVNIFNTDNPYDLEKMPELSQLKSQYDLMKQSGSSKEETEYVRRFFQTRTNTGVTQRCDIQLQALQRYYQVLAANDASTEEKNSVMSVMKKIDNARRADIYGTVDNALSELETRATSPKEDSGKKSEKDSEEDRQLNDGLLRAITESKSAVSAGKTEAEGGLLEEGDSVLDGAEYRACLSLIQHAEENNHAACDGDNERLINLNNIKGSVIAHKEAELALLEELIGEADHAYGVKLWRGETQAYQSLKAQNTAHAALNNRRKQDMEEVNTRRSELQFFIQEKTDRMEKEAAQTYILDRIRGVAQFRQMIPSDDYKNSAADTVESYREWLENLLNQIKKEGQAEGSRDGENLYEQKKELQEQKMEALDDLNLDTAKKINAELEQVDQKISELEAAAENEIRDLENRKREVEAELASQPGNEKLNKELSDLEAQIAGKTTDFPSDSKAGNISDMKTNAEALIRKEDTSQASLDELSGYIDGLGSLAEGGSALALDAMKEIYKELVSAMYLNDKEGYEDLVEKMEEDIAQIDIPGVLGQELTAGNAVKAVEEVLGKEIGTAAGTGSGTDSGSGQEGLTDEEAAGAVIALAEYGEKSGNKEIAELAKSMAAGLSNGAQGYVSKTYVSGGELFAPVDAVARFIRYRYLWDNTKREAVLSRGGAYCRFTAGSRQVVLENDTTEEMEKAAEFSEILYLPDSYLQKQFGCSVYDLYGTGYCVLVSQEIRELSEELLAQLAEKGGTWWEI